MFRDCPLEIRTTTPRGKWVNNQRLSYLQHPIEIMLISFIPSSVQSQQCSTHGITRVHWCVPSVTRWLWQLFPRAYMATMLHDSSDKPRPLIPYSQHEECPAWEIMTHWVLLHHTPDSKVHGANMGPIWGRQDPGGPHVGPMNFAIWDYTVIQATNVDTIWLNF